MFVVLTINEKIVYIAETSVGNVVVIPKKYVLQNAYDPQNTTILVCTEQSGAYPLKELRLFTSNDEKEFPDIVSAGKLTQISNLPRLEITL